MDPFEEEQISKMAIEAFERTEAVKAKLPPIEYMVWRVGFLVCGLADTEASGAVIPEEVRARSNQLIAERAAEVRSMREKDKKK